MKKILSIALCAAAVSAFADPTETVLGQVGVTAINSGLKNTIVAVSYDDLAGASGSGIVVSNFVKTANLKKDDQLAIFNGTGTYDTWVLDEKDGVKFWAKSDVTYTVDATGQLVKGTGESADEITQVVGTGIWLVRQDCSKPFYVYGKPVTSPTTTTAAGAWTLIGNPKQTVSKVFEIGTVSKATDGDQIVAPNEQDGTLCYYTYNSDHGWRTTDADGAWDNEHPPTLKPGLGCWIRTKTASTINW